MEEQKLPEKKFRAGAISATIWANPRVNKTGQPFEVKSVQIDRSYKDQNNQWQHTASFRVADLPKISVVLGKAYEYLVMNSNGVTEEVVA